MSTTQIRPAQIQDQGTGGGLDSDTVDGSHANAFATSGHTHPAGTATDADTVDGQHANAFAAASHTHVEADITDLGDYAAADHNHSLASLSDVLIAGTPADREGAFLRWDHAGGDFWYPDVTGFAAANHQHTSLDSLIVNDGGSADNNFRVESDTEQNMILVDASEDKLTLGGILSSLQVDKGGDTTWNGDSSGLAYGAFYGNEIAWTASLNNANAIISDSDLACDRANLITFQNNRELKIQKSGIYLCNWYVSAEASTANQHIIGGLMVNSTTVIRNEGMNHTEHTSANRELAMSGTAIIELSADEVIGVGVGTDGNCTLRADHVGLSIIMIGGT